MVNKSWIIDGNYSKIYFDERSNDADIIIYLNYNRFICLYRVIKRYIKYKNTSRPSAGEGCIETINYDFLSFVIYRSRKKSKLNKFKDIKNKYPDKFFEIKNDKELNKFIENML